MKLANLLIVFALCLSADAFATNIKLDSLNRDAKYVETIKGRSQKIVDKLVVCNAEDAVNVHNIIANRYFQLNDIYEKRDANLKMLKEAGTNLTDEQKKSERQHIADTADAELYRTHSAYLASLNLFLNNKQIDKVKDEMTYNVLMVTYTATLDMIPSLKEEEKKRIYTWLWEAREYAMNGENSSKKHEIFGKYKGRINNYLSQRGYNLTQERIEWEKRLKEKEKR